MLKKTLSINGMEKRVVVDPKVSLASVLRKQMFLTGTKVGCGKGECGACTVILNGKAVRSCSLKMKEVPDEAQVITIEGVGTAASLHPLQLAWLIHGTEQGSFSVPGFIMSAKAMLDQNADPTKEEVSKWFLGNRTICSFDDEASAVDAVLDAARLMRGEATAEELWSKLKGKINKASSGWPDSSAVAKATGSWDFGPDLGLKLPESTLYMKLVQAEVSHGNILAVDTSEAEAMPGVYKIITCRDVPGTNRISGSGRTILADKKILQPKEAIAVILAFKPGLAEEAAKKVKVKIEALPGSDAAKEKEHLSIEPEAGFAYLTEKGKLMIHTGNADSPIHELAEGIGITPEKLTIVPNPSAGADKCQSTPAIEGLLGVAALVAKRPVYLNSEEV